MLFQKTQKVSLFLNVKKKHKIHTVEHYLFNFGIDKRIFGQTMRRTIC